MAACVWNPSDGFFGDRKFLGVSWLACLDDLQVQWKLPSQNKWKAIEEETWHRPLAYMHAHPNVNVHTHTNMYMHHTHNATHTHTLKTNFTMCILSLGPGSDILGLTILHVWGHTCNICVCAIYGPMLSPWRPRCGIHWVAGRALKTPSETWEQELHLSVWFLFTNFPLAEAGHIALSVTKNRGKTHLHTENWKYAQQGHCLVKVPHYAVTDTGRGELRSLYVKF